MGDALLLLLVAEQVHPVQVLAVEVVAEHPLEDALGVQHWDEREVEAFAQQVGAIVSLV